MNLRYKYIFLFAFVISTTISIAQDCRSFYKSSRCFASRSDEFKQYGQARGAAVEVGETYALQTIMYGQKDFIVSVCAESGYKKLHFKIIDKDKNETLYDNTDDDYNQYIGFAMENTRTVTIELTILSEKKDNVDPMKDRVCVGVQIVWRKIPQLGFKGNKKTESEDKK